MADRPLNTLRKAIDAAGIADWEIIYDQTVSSPVSFEYDRLKEMGYKEASGFGLRVVADGKIGFAPTTDPARIGDLPGQALASARFGETAGFAFPGESELPVVATEDESVRKFSQDMAIERGEALIERIKSELPDVQAGADFRSSLSTRRILNSSGFDGRYEHTSLGVSVEGILVEGDSIQGIYESHSACRDDADLDAMGTKVIERFEASRKVVSLESGEYPILFTPKALRSLLAAVMIGTNGRTVQKGASPLTGRIGEQILDSRITLTDDPLIDHYTASRPFDDEGLPSRKNVVIENGVLKQFLFDLQTAARMKLNSTASAGRGFSSPPSPGFSTLVMDAGSDPIEEIVGRISKGILVDQVLGGGQSNLLMGEFSVNIDLGFMIEGGELAGRVKDTMVAGNAYEALRSIDAISIEREHYGGLLVPSILFSSLPVVSKG